MRLWGTVRPRTVWHIPPTGMTAKEAKETLGKDKGKIV
jgi:hypothetical protein